MSDDFPAPLRQFVVDNISSVAQLEVLLLLRNEPERNWTAEDVARTLYASANMSLAQLLNLQALGFLAQNEGPPPSFCYRPRNPGISAAVDSLAEAYAGRRVALITLIYSKPIDPAQSFADAFRLRKEN